MANETVFKRYAGNPVVTATLSPRQQHPQLGDSQEGEGDYAGVFRVDEISMRLRAPRRLQPGRHSLGHRSRARPDPEQQPRRLRHGLQLRPSPHAVGGYVLPHLVQRRSPGSQDRVCHHQGLQDLTQGEDLLPPANRNCVLSRARSGATTPFYHRPSDRGHTPFGDIFYATSPDFEHWGWHRFVVRPGWAAGRDSRSARAPHPIETDDGWLLIYHGVWRTCNGYLYYIGGALLDLDQPWKVLYRTKDYLLSPSEIYERVGDVPNVCFPASAVMEPGDILRLYYGCADTCVSMAEAKLDDVVEFVKEHSF